MRDYLIGITGTFLDHGYLWVDGLFILSGFILAYNYDPAPGERLDWKKFVIARITRIYSAYVASLLAFTAAVIGRDLILHSAMVGSTNYNFARLPAWAVAT